jgi:hypothetical protein
MGGTQSQDVVVCRQGQETPWTVLQSMSDDDEHITVFEHEISDPNSSQTRAAINARSVRESPSRPLTPVISELNKLNDWFFALVTLRHNLLRDFLVLSPIVPSVKANFIASLNFD